MRRTALLIVLGSSLAFAQAAKPAAPAAAPEAGEKAAPATTVAESAPVISLNVPCGSGDARKDAAGNCREVVTRAQFEKLVNALAPELPPQARRQVAQQYSEMLEFAARAQTAGLQNDPKVQEIMKFARANVLAKYFVQQLQKKAEDVTPQEIESYYNGNKERFEQAKIERIYIPKPFGANPAAAQQTAVQQLADKMRARAAAGEDMAKLEEEAYEQVKTSSDVPEAQKKNFVAPSVDLGDVRRGRLPGEHEKAVFALAPGQVTAVIAEASGYFIYKVVSKNEVPLEQAKDEIKQLLARQNFEKQMQEMRDGAKMEFNEAYFGAAPQGAPKTPGAAAKPKAPASQSESTPKK